LRETVKAVVKTRAASKPKPKAKPTDSDGRPVRVLAAVNEARPRIPTRSVRLVGEEVSMTLRSGAVVFLGTLSQLPLKVAVAVRVLGLSPTARTIDVSVPERAVATDPPSGEQ